jgi:hypothetical protein
VSKTISLTDYIPADRFDGQPWTAARLEEAPNAEGPWTPIDEFTLSPLDTDPTEPQPRSFTSSNGSLEVGWYRIIWVGALLDESATPPIYLNRVRLSFEPSLADVGALIRTRTTPRGATAELGTFTADTRPTGDQVSALITKSVGKVLEKVEIAGLVGGNLPTELLDPAREAAALRTAMLVELTFYGDQISVSRGPFKELKDLYKEAIDELAAAVEAIGPDGEIGTDDDRSATGMPSWSFPNLGADRHVPGAEIPNDTAPSWMDW